ncbi:MAG TPA: hypothetical protein VFU49_21905, partial [Ktedonobacteraceae bacterium]|nr:hypothetical protein [Ktedonobacteraceae bacterium]
LPVSLLLLFLVFSLLTQTGNPFIQFSPTDVTKAQLTEQSLAVLGIVLQSMLLVMLILFAIRRWRMPLGTFTLVLTLNAISLGIMRDHYLIIPIFAIAGGIIDGVYHLLKPTIERVDQFRLFAAIVPTIIFLVYFLTLWMTMGIVWSIHLSVGSVVVSGIAGWLVSYIMIPPAMPSEQTPL